MNVEYLKDLRNKKLDLDKKNKLLIDKLKLISKYTCFIEGLNYYNRFKAIDKTEYFLDQDRNRGYEKDWEYEDLKMDIANEEIETIKEEGMKNSPKYEEYDYIDEEDNHPKELIDELDEEDSDRLDVYAQIAQDKRDRKNKLRKLRLDDLEKLIKLRKKNDIEIDNTMKYYFNGLINQYEDYKNELFENNQNFLYRKKGSSGVSHPFHDFRKFSNDKLIKIFKITEDEQLFMKSIISKKEKQRRNNEYNKMKFKKQRRKKFNGKTYRETKKLETEEQIKLLIRDKSMNQTQVANELGLNKSTISRCYRNLFIKKERL